MMPRAHRAGNDPPSGAVSIDNVTFANNLTCDIKNNGALKAEQLDFKACP